MSVMPRWPDWPITLKVPLVVMLLMLAIGVAISNTVLSRLTQTQERHLQTLSRAYLDGLSASLQPQILHEDVWEVFDTVQRAHASFAGLHPLNTVVLNAVNRVIAASNPHDFPTGQQISPQTLNGLVDDGTVLLDEARRTARMLNVVTTQGQPVGSIYAELDISALLVERREVLWELILTNGAVLVLLMAAGYWAVRRMVEPVRVLGAYLERGTDRGMEIIPDWQLRSATKEFSRLFKRYNAMARAANERLELTERLAEEERLASLGRLASGMAHEINNPLGGLFNALDALKRYGHRDEVRHASIRLLERGLAGIRDAVRATLMTYRKPGEKRVLQFQDLEDLRHLIQPALRQRGLALDWHNDAEGVCALSAALVRDAALNLLLNACAASPEGSTVSFGAQRIGGSLEINVCDKGTGLPQIYRHLLQNDGPVSELPKAGGLGLWMVRRLLDELRGRAEVDATSDGTVIRLIFPLPVEDARHVA